MAEIERELINQTYKITKNEKMIMVIIDTRTGKITLKRKDGRLDFIFQNSDPKMLFDVGTMIREAANLVNAHE